MRIITAVVGMVVMPAFVYAGGTIDFSEVKSLFKANPKFAAAVSSLKIEETGFAEIVIDFKQPHLGGHRLGPYTFEIKGSEKQKTELLLCTKPHFKNLKGNKTNFFDATKVSETLEAVILRKEGSAVTCPVEDDT